MIAILSPAMNMAKVNTPDISLTEPVFIQNADELAKSLQTYSPWELESLLDVNPQLALRAYEAYRDFGEGKGSPATLSFYGLAYQNLSAQDFSAEDFAFASEHLRILSALYGLLCPTDEIHPYRLDFMCRWAKQQKLYGYWGESVCRELYRQTDTVINLCSGEYEKLIIPHLTRQNRLVSCRFLENKAGKLICRATASKMARGQMARFIILNRIDKPEMLKEFDWGDYEFVEQLSGERQLIFVRGGEAGNHRFRQDSNET